MTMAPRSGGIFLAGGQPAARPPVFPALTEFSVPDPPPKNAAGQRKGCPKTGVLREKSNLRREAEGDFQEEARDCREWSSCRACPCRPASRQVSIHCCRAASHRPRDAGGPTRKRPAARPS